MSNKRSLLLLLAAGALALGGPKPALAQSKVKAAKREYKLGYQDLQAGKFADALVHYRRSYELSARPRTLFNMALCEEALGQDDDAYRHFTEFVANAEDRDAAYAAQARRKLAELAKKLTGRVTIESTPPGATVRIDGGRRSRGRTPLTLSLPPGEHIVRVSIDGATPVERTVRIAPRSQTELRVELSLSATVVLTTEPSDAEILRQGESKPTRGSYRAQVLPGTYEFVVRRAGYATQKVTVKVPASGTYEQRVQLRPKITSATLLIDSGGGQLRIDGAATTAGDDKARRLPPGEHEIRVDRAGRQPWTRKLHLSPGEIVSVDVDLARRRPAGWIRWGGIALGAAALATGGTLGVMALRDVTSDASDRHSRGKSRALIADGLMIAGAAVIVAVWRLTRGEPSRAQIRRRHGGW